MRQSAAVETMYQANKERADFLLVYIREAHPSDSNWGVKGMTQTEPKSLDERIEAAKKLRDKAKLTMPMVVDEMDDVVNMRYGAWPERIYIIGVDGKIAYRTALGPDGFVPKKAREAL